MFLVIFNVTQYFTDKEGEFVFGPLCANKSYAIEIWVDQVKHCKICAEGKHEGKCLKGVKLDCKHDFSCCKPCEKKCEDKCEKKCEEKYEDKCEKKCEDKYEKPCCRPCCR